MRTKIQSAGIALGLLIAAPVAAQTVPVVCYDILVRVLNANNQPLRNVQVEYSTPYKNSGFMALDQAVAHRICVNEPQAGKDPDRGVIKVRASNARMTMSARFEFPLTGDADIQFQIQP